MQHDVSRGRKSRGMIGSFCKSGETIVVRFSKVLINTLIKERGFAVNPHIFALALN
jgi:hypothetical protein